MSNLQPSGLGAVDSIGGVIVDAGNFNWGNGASNVYSHLRVTME